VAARIFRGFVAASVGREERFPGLGFVSRSRLGAISGMTLTQELVREGDRRNAPRLEHQLGEDLADNFEAGILVVKERGDDSRRGVGAGEHSGRSTYGRRMLDARNVHPVVPEAERGKRRRFRVPFDE
jgi:hypothetical protein